MNSKGLSALETLVVVVVVLLLAALVLPMRTHGRRGSRKTDCKNSLKQIGVYVALYESKFRSNPDMSDPRWLGLLWRTDMAQDGNLFRCAVRGKAGAGTHFRALRTPVAFPRSDGSVARILEHPPEDAPPELPIVADLPNNHDDVGPDVNVLFYQGRVDVFDKESERCRIVDALLMPSAWAAPAGTR